MILVKENQVDWLLAMLKTVFASTALMNVCVNAQQVGTQVKEAHPSLPMTTCNSVGECTQESTTVVLGEMLKDVVYFIGFSLGEECHPTCMLMCAFLFSDDAECI